MRTVPFAVMLQRLARLARDVGYQAAKSIELTMEGDDILVERVSADPLADSLMHMVRNAVDHGIEPADERVRLGKSPIGRLTISARRVGELLEIELSDDGRGIDPQRVARIAVQRGFISRDARLTEREVLALLFRPG